jgi:membrane-bound metal-dependent hydrolase YbcI (DUF457 family)
MYVEKRSVQFSNAVSLFLEEDKMAQAGMHALVGLVARNSTKNRTWLFLGVLLGSMFPDMDNYLVAIGTVTGMDEPGEVFHRTFTHSVFTILAVLVIFFVVGTLRKDQRWNNLGIGFGVGIALHMLLDLVIWFNGVPLFWPLGSELNFWSGYSPPEALVKILNPAELLFFGLFFFWLLRTAQTKKTDLNKQKSLQAWMNAMYLLFVVFAVLAFVNIGNLSNTVNLVYGLVYLVALTAAFVYTIQMRKTVEAA